MTRDEEIAARVAEVRGRIAAAARRAGRDPESVTLVAVTKTRPAEDLLAAWRAGVTHFGENRVQEAESKFPSVPPGGVRHLIGPVQSNKAARAARIADVVQTVDSPDLARRLDRAAEGKRLAVFLEVLLGDESTKAGVTPADLPLPSWAGGMMRRTSPADSLQHAEYLVLDLDQLSPGMQLPRFSQGHEVSASSKLSDLYFGQFKLYRK